MSLPLESLPEDARPDAEPAAPTRPWIRVAGSFAAGVGFAVGAGCAALAIIHLAGPLKSAQPQQPKVRAPAEIASSSAPAAPSERSATDTDAADRSCARRTWPYVDQSCAGTEVNAQATRSVRVIATDRGAPATVMTIAPLPGSRTTDGFASAALAAPESASANRPSGGNMAPGQADVPMPRAKPDELVRRAAALANEPDTIHQGMTNDQPPAAESRQARKSAERRSTRRSVAERDAKAEPRGETRPTDTRETQDEQALQVRALSFEDPSRTARARATEQEFIQAGRSRATSSEDGDGYTLVRTYRRDGRRGSVRQKAVEAEGGGGTAAREEQPRSPFPFFFNPASPE
jgi:hypothetical protein